VSVRRAGAVAIIALLAAAVMLAVRPMRYEVDGLSMAPSLMPGDTVATDWLPLADRFRHPRRFERWIVDAADGTATIKRVAGLPGEEVAIQDGDLLVDGEAVLKSPTILGEVALPVALPIEHDDGQAWMPPVDVLDDVTFAAEVNRSLESVRDVGIAAVVHAGPDGSRARVAVGDARITWRLPAGVCCQLIAGRLDGRLVAVAWIDRDRPTADDRRSVLPNSTPGAWTVAVPWPQGMAGPTEAGCSAALDAGGKVEHIAAWRDIHYRPSMDGPTTWRLDEDSFLVLGDFPTGSVDSRAWGPRPRHSLRHRVAPQR
jgi:signal peptidase I